MTERRVSEIRSEYLVDAATNQPTGYKLSDLGLIPEDWSVSNVKDISAIPMQNGLFYEPKRKGKGVPLINVGDMYKSAPVNVESLELFDASPNEIKIFKVEVGDLFFTRSSVVPSGIAFCNIYNSEQENVVFDSHLIRVRPNKEFIDPNYLYLNCIAKHARSALIASAKTATMTTIDQGAINRCPVLLPPINEQTAIANALSDVDALIQELEKLIAKKQAIKTATMQQLLTGRTRLPQFAHHQDGRKRGYKPSELGEIPEDWEVCEFGSLLQEFRNGYAFSADGYEQTGIPIITMAQIGLSGCFQFDIAKVNKWDMNQLDKLKEFWVQNGDLLIAMTDVTPDKNLIGQMTIAKLDCVAFLNQRVGLLRMRSGVADATFFSFLSCLPVWKQYCRGVASLGVQANIGTTDIRKAKVYCPPIGEQAAITRILSDIDSEIQAQQHRLDKTRQIKQGMMQELLTGRIRLVQSLNEVMHE